MMIVIQHPTTVYVTEAKAAEVVAKLNADAKAANDDWTYAVKSRVKDRYVIEICDENGDFLGYL